MTDATDLGARFQAMHDASRSSVAVDHQTRMDRLARLRDMVVQNDARIVAAINADFGCRVADETRLMEIVPLMNALRHTRRKLRRWMRPARRPVSVVFWPASARVVPQPLGLVGIVAPWNYPLLLTLGPLVDALAAGNRAMIKPSELGPVFAELLGELVAQAFAADEVTVVTGGSEIGQAFCGLPFDHLFFTGSTAVGRKVAQAAAANLTPVTLELGGKSPALVMPDADIPGAARSIAFGKYVNAGQTCIAPDYVLVPRADLAGFTDALADHIRRTYPDLSDGYTAVISQKHFERQVGLLAGLGEDVRVIRIGEDAPAQRKLAPALVIDPALDSQVMREEIFGPVLPILPYDRLESALDLVNSGPRPLAAYCFSKDAQQVARMIDQTVSGGMTINATLLHIAQDELPFGGVGASGMGSYHGYAGFARFSHMKPVFKVGFFNAFERMGPPWGRLARMTYRFLGR